MNQAKKFLGIIFDCCHIYVRIYVNRGGDAYVGRCPRCGRSLRVPIGAQGTDDRFFRAQ